MQERVVLEPKYMNRKLEESVRRKLIADVEGACTAECGYVLCIIGIESISATEVEESTGCATFLAEYSALTLYPKNGEVVNGVVQEINKMGVFCFIGPFSIFVSMYQIPGHFTEAGENSSILPNDGGTSIVKGSVLRVKIIGVKVEPTKIFGIGTIYDDYLGTMQCI